MHSIKKQIKNQRLDKKHLRHVHQRRKFSVYFCPGVQFKIHRVFKVSFRSKEYLNKQTSHPTGISWISFPERSDLFFGLIEIASFRVTKWHKGTKWLHKGMSHVLQKVLLSFRSQFNAGKISHIKTNDENNLLPLIFVF